jgi:myo-inositol-1(or 4)-monophosphatase
LTAGATAKSSRTDLVTDADKASEQLILERLLAARPDDAVLAEEGGVVAGTSGLRWVVDPLDGTINFLYGFPAFAVSIACLDAEGAVAGVVHDPLRPETFRAARGAGAWLGSERLTVGRGPETGEALIGTGFGYGSDRRAAQARLLTGVLPAVRDIRRSGSAALDLCYVAARRLDAFYEAGLQPWDHAAAALVVEEAGGEVSFVDGLLPGVETVLAGPARLCAGLRRLLESAAAPGSVGSE